jgi:hypothetical protein
VYLLSRLCLLRIATSTECASLMVLSTVNVSGLLWAVPMDLSQYSLQFMSSRSKHRGSHF